MGDPALILAVALLGIAPAALACVPAAVAARSTVVTGKRFEVALRADPSPAPVNTHFRLDLHVCELEPVGAPTALTVSRVDATMPAHRHGMNYTPTVAAHTADGWTHRAEGFLFHMPGQWEYAFEVRRGGVQERLTSPVAAR